MKFGVLAFISESSARPEAVARKCEELGTRDSIRAMKELWTKPEPSDEGEFVKLAPVRSYPNPARNRTRQSSSAREESGAATIARLRTPWQSATEGLPS